jgi:DNA-binding LacI/PurR family transcriptional regulator
MPHLPGYRRLEFAPARGNGNPRGGQRALPAVAIALYCIDMPNTISELEAYLDELAAHANAGDQLPTIRELMRRFGVSQTVVQRAFQNLKTRGLVDAQVGRGTFFVTPGRHADASAPAGAPPTRRDADRTASRTVLLLRRSISITRGRALVEKLHQHFVDNGHQVLEVAYSDPAHARAALKGLPRFDACVIQSTFKSIPIELLAAIREKADVIAVDGLALVGADVEAVGTEWGEPLAEAVRKLVQRGHRKLAFAATSQPLLATQLGFRRSERLQADLGEASLLDIRLPALPDGEYLPSLVAQLKEQMQKHGGLPFSALIAWGIEDGERFRQMLQEIGIAVPRDLSVVLLGRTDLANEHGAFFETIGCSVADQVDALYQAVARHWQDEAQPYGVHLTPITRLPGASIADRNAPR